MRLFKFNLSLSLISTQIDLNACEIMLEEAYRAKEENLRIR